MRVVFHDQRHAVQSAQPLDGIEIGVGPLRRGERPGAVQGDVDVETQVRVRARDVRLGQLDARHLPRANQGRGVAQAELGEVGRAWREARATRGGERERQHGGGSSEHGRLLDESYARLPGLVGSRHESMASG